MKLIEIPQVKETIEILFDFIVQEGFPPEGHNYFDPEQVVETILKTETKEEYSQELIQSIKDALARDNPVSNEEADPDTFDNKIFDKEFYMCRFRPYGVSREEFRYFYMFGNGNYVYISLSNVKEVRYFWFQFRGLKKILPVAVLDMIQLELDHCCKNTFLSMDQFKEFLNQNKEDLAKKYLFIA
jgi:hypothetical protein